MMHIAKSGEKTERQWNMAGYRVKKGEVGAERWINGFCKVKGTYFTTDQVRKMTEKQAEKWKEQERLRRNEMARNARKKRIEQERARLERIERELAEERRLWEQEHEAREKAVQNIYDSGFKVVLVDIKGYGGYMYAVPKDTKIGALGTFPFGDEVAEGEVVAEVESKDFVDARWFPHRLKTAKEIIAHT